MTDSNATLLWTKEEKALGREIIKSIAVYVHEELELADWFDGKPSSFGNGQVSIWPEDAMIIARYIAKHYTRNK